MPLECIVSKKEQANLQTALHDVSFTCGAQLQDLELPGRLNKVYTRKISCEQPIEKLYYSALSDITTRIQIVGT